MHHPRAPSTGPALRRPVMAPRPALPYLQAAAGNQAVNALRRRTDAGSPATIQPPRAGQPQARAVPLGRAG
ncbi:MAG TPA: hypothetical protein VKV73_30485 [Chloroflexota bacterium]|nr:hypothetical protein [Chloroflexota bacterium]